MSGEHHPIFAQQQKNCEIYSATGVTVVSLPTPYTLRRFRMAGHKILIYIFPFSLEYGLMMSLVFSQ